MQEYIKLLKLQKRIRTELNYNKKLTREQKYYIQIWVKQYNYNFNMISLAFHYTTNKENPNYNYIHTILSDWYYRNFTTKENVIQWVNSAKKKKQS